MKISVRLGVGYGLVLVLLACIAMLGMNGMNGSNDALHHIVDVNIKKMALLEDMSDSVHIVSRVVRSIALLDDENQANIEFQKILAAREKYNESFDYLEKMPLDDAGKAFVSRFKEEANTARALNTKFLELGKSNRSEAIKFLLKEAGPATSQWQDSIHEFIDLQRAKSKKDEETAASTFEESRLFMLGLSVLAILTGSAAAYLITKSITVPINAAVQIAQTVASGDLTSHIEVNATDETGQLLSALKEMNLSLVKIVGQVRTGTETISSASKQIATGNMDLSSRTEEQASSLEETASSMEELTSTVKQNADNARQANLLAVSASDSAIKGSSVVARVVDTMGSINDSSRKIVDIIGVIDGIAFQTNILALNAAVEAARAGEQGRGFAVVASEVRNLAQRSAAAAKEIKTLIGDSVNQVDAGAKLVEQAGTTMQEIVESIQRVTDIMVGISTASIEQSSGIEQINQAITNMDDVTQQNAALVEEAASAAQSLQDQAVNLNEVVSVFKLDHTQTTTERRSANKVQMIKTTKSQFEVGKSVPALMRQANTNEQDWEEF